MPANFPEILRREIAEIEGELASDPRYQKLQTLRAALALYEGKPEVQGSAAAVTRQIASAPQKMATSRQTSAARAKALELAKAFVQEHAGEPVPTRLILETITEQGAQIGGKSKVGNLSAMLSHDDRFVSHGRAGWTLMETDSDSSPISETGEPDATSEESIAAAGDGGVPPVSWTVMG